MSGGTELEIDDMPAQVRDEPRANLADWESGLKQWANRQLNDGHSDLLGIAQPAVERILIRCALNKTQDRRQEAAKLIGWGRNTLTRKIKELEID
jgi:two-component system nitrogen regulation response regulator GlnG